MEHTGSPESSPDKKSRYHPLGLLRGSLRASLTVEAALVLPVFLAAVMAVMSFMQILQLQTRIQQSMDEAVSKAAGYYYVLERKDIADAIGGTDGKELGEILLQGGITAAYLKQSVISSAGEEYLDNSWISGGKSGLTIIGSQLPDADGNIDLVISYSVKIPFLPGQVGKISITQRECQRAWQGNHAPQKDSSGESEGSEGNDENDQIVYVAVNGSVYHTSFDCSYLRVSVREVSYSLVGEYRNSSGGKYYPCDRCKGKTPGHNVFITESGSRYHVNRNCPSLKRSYTAMKLSETGGLLCCSLCSKAKG